MNLEETLRTALSITGCVELPKEEEEGKIWITAIGYVKKSDGTSSYVIMGKDKYGKSSIKRDLGTISSIHEIVSIHPTKNLNTKYVKYINPNNSDQEAIRQEIISFINERRKDFSYSQLNAMSNRDLKDLLYYEAIQDQLIAEKSNAAFSVYDSSSNPKTFEEAVIDDKKTVETLKQKANGNKGTGKTIKGNKGETKVGK